MIRTGERPRKIYAFIQIAYAIMIFYKLFLTFGNLHISEISVYAIFVLITPVTMNSLIKSSSTDTVEYFRLLLYSIIEISYLTESVGLIVVNFIPVLFILFSLVFFLIFIREKTVKAPFKPAKLNIV